MRAAWIAALALGLLAAGNAAVADDTSDDTTAKPPPARQGTTWTWSQLGGMFGGPDKSPAPTITVEKPMAARPPAAANRAISPVQKETRDLAREESAFTRRLAVCDKLKQIAMEKNDPRLQREAELLEERATAVYHQRTDHLADNVRTPTAVEPVPDNPAREPATPASASPAPVHAVSSQVHQATVPDSVEDNP